MTGAHAGITGLERTPTWQPITDPEQAEQLYEAGLLWEHNVSWAPELPPEPAHGWGAGCVRSLLSSGDYPHGTDWRLYIQLED